MMEDSTTKYLEEPELKNTILVEGLPGIGLVGKLAADHLHDELKTTKFAEIYSPYLPPQVNIQPDGTVELVKMHFHYYKGKEKDIIFLLGDFQGISPDSQYRLTDKTLDLAERFNVKTLITLGGLGTGAITHTPRVFGATTSKGLKPGLEEHGVIFKGGGAIFGASGLLLGLGMERGFDGICLMGETHGQIIDAKSAEAVLNVLTKIIGLDVDMAALEKKAKDTEEQISQMGKMISSYKEQAERQQELMSETPTYIR
ncbi:proteasome assembly chaperone family protein [Candidatus Altiarchaeota archaeon]